MLGTKRLTDRDAATTVAERIELVTRMNDEAATDTFHIAGAQSVR